MKFFVCKMMQETNSFNPVAATLADFSDGIFEGQAVADRTARTDPTVDGMLDVLERNGHSVTGGVCMHAQSGGPVGSQVVEWFLGKILPPLRDMAPDGVLLSLHGATLSETSSDVCGDILSAVRETVGENAVIAASCDLHANVTEKMMKAADFICGYQTYPHLDFYEVGVRAATLACRKAAGETFITARVSLPMMAPAHGYTTGDGKLGALMRRAKELVASQKIEDFSIFQVQPWMDISGIASTVLVTAKDEKSAKQTAAALAKEEFELRHDLLGERLFTVREVAEKALANREDKPVVLVDSADSPNAGATGDSAEVLRDILPYRNTLRAAVIVRDKAAVEKAFRLGVGGKADFTLGASVAPRLFSPVTLPDATVHLISEGSITLEGPAWRGETREMGKSAVLSAGKISVLVTGQAGNYGDRQCYRGFGIEPTLQDLVCVKACTSFRAGYEPISAEICNAATPGAAGVVLQDMPFENLPKPFFPFEEITEADIPAPVIDRK